MLQLVSMKTSVKQLSDTRVELTVELGRAELEDARLVSLKKLARETKIPGFRNGRAPANVVEKHVNPNILAEQELHNALDKGVAKAFVDEGIQALARPDVEVKKYVPGDQLEFTATTEVFPVVELGDYKKLKTKKTKVTVSEAEVDDVLKNIQEGYAEKKEVKRAAKMGDEVVIDFTGMKDGAIFPGGTATNYALKLGSNAFIPGFEDGIAGHKAGDKFKLKLKFPENYHATDLKGQSVVFEVVLHKVNGLSLPKIDMELVKKCGPFKTIAELKADIKKNLVHQKEHETVGRLKDALISELVETSKVPVPEVLLNDQIQAIRQDTAQNMLYKGTTLQDYLASINKSEDEWLEQDVKKAAEVRVKGGLVLSALSRELKITVSNEEVEAKLGELLDVYKKNDEAIKQLKTESAKVDVTNRLVTEKTTDELVRLTKNT